MKKTMRMMGLALAVCLVLAGAAPAEGNAERGPLYRVFQAGERLLTGEENMTLRGEATFTLDGKMFKHARGILAQESWYAYQQIELETPRRDGSTLESGYAVADFGGVGYAVERYLKNERIRMVSNEPKNHALRDTVSSVMMMKMAGSIAAALDTETADRVTAESVPEGESISLRWDRTQMPALLDAGANLAWQYAARRFFYVDYTKTAVEGYASVEDYLTVTEGLLYCARELEIREIQADVKLDGEGRLTSLQGEAAVTVHCRNGETRELGITFSLTGENYGTTEVEKVIPEKNLVNITDWSISGQGEYDGENTGLPIIPVLWDRLTHRNLAGEADAAAYAGQIAAMDALAFSDAEGLVWQADDLGDGNYEVRGAYEGNTESPVLYLLISKTGEVRQILNYTTRLEEAAHFESADMDSDEVIAWRNAIETMLWRFTENLNPGSTEMTEEELVTLRETTGAAFTGYEETLVSGDETFVVMYGGLHRKPEEEKVKFIVQTSPVVRVVWMDSTIDPAEGGQG